MSFFHAFQTVDLQTSKNEKLIPKSLSHDRQSDVDQIMITGKRSQNAVCVCAFIMRVFFPRANTAAVRDTDTETETDRDTQTQPEAEAEAAVGITRVMME